MSALSFCNSQKKNFNVSASTQTESPKISSNCCKSKSLLSSGCRLGKNAVTQVDVGQLAKSAQSKRGQESGDKKRQNFVNTVVKLFKEKSPKSFTKRWHGGDAKIPKSEKLSDNHPVSVRHEQSSTNGTTQEGTDSRNISSTGRFHEIITGHPSGLDDLFARAKCESSNDFHEVSTAFPDPPYLESFRDNVVTVRKPMCSSSSEEDSAPVASSCFVYENKCSCCEFSVPNTCRHWHPCCKVFLACGWNPVKLEYSQKSVKIDESKTVSCADIKSEELQICICMKSTSNLEPPPSLNVTEMLDFNDIENDSFDEDTSSENSLVISLGQNDQLPSYCLYPLYEANSLLVECPSLELGPQFGKRLENSKDGPTTERFEMEELNFDENISPKKPIAKVRFNDISKNVESESESCSTFSTAVQSVPSGQQSNFVLETISKLSAAIRFIATIFRKKNAEF